VPEHAAQLFQAGIASIQSRQGGFHQQDGTGRFHPWKGHVLKSFTRTARATGTERQRINQIINRTGRYSPTQLAKRAARAGRKHRWEGGLYVA
jgi:hypothetical protein